MCKTDYANESPATPWQGVPQRGVPSLEPWDTPRARLPHVFSGGLFSSASERPLDSGAPRDTPRTPLPHVFPGGLPPSASERILDFGVRRTYQQGNYHIYAPALFRPHFLFSEAEPEPGRQDVSEEPGTTRQEAKARREAKDRRRQQRQETRAATASMRHQFKK